MKIYLIKRFNWVSIMNVEFINLKAYLEEKEKNIFIKSFWYSITIGVLLILVVLFISYEKKDLYYENILIIENNAVFLNVNYNDWELIKNNKEIIIGDKRYNYHIKNINFVNNGNLYYQIEILINDRFVNIEQGLLEYKIFLREESILKYLVRVVKGV